MHDGTDIPPVITDYQRRPLQPVAAGDRIEALDVLRGVALFGILTVNIVGFSWPTELAITQRQFWETRADVRVDWILQFLAEGKFYPLFSFLFGLGASIQMQRAEACEARFAGRYCRRLLVLLGFGLVHALFIWDGDILVWYALCGFLLLPFRKRQPRTMLIWAAVCLLLPMLVVGLLWGGLVVASLWPEMAATIQRELTQYSTAPTEGLEETVRVFATGSYAEMFRQRFGSLVRIWMMGLFYLPEFLGLFLLGMYAGRRRWLHDVEANASTIRRIFLWGLIIGLPANLFYSVTLAHSDLSDRRYWWLLSYAFAMVGGPAQSFAYAAAVTLLWRRERMQQWLHPLGDLGRMALTNYLLQSLICTTIFYSYGLGLFGTMGRMAGLGVVLAVFLAQLGFSRWWLRHFQFGPMEWLWRTLTYGSPPPMRLAK